MASLGTGWGIEESKAAMKGDYYPEEALDFARKNPKFMEKVESSLLSVHESHASKSFPNLTSSKRAFLTMYVYEHFKLDMCSYGGKNTTDGRSVTDVCWKQGCRVPDILASEVIALINKGIITSDHEAIKNSIFQASILISGFTKGFGTDDVKKIISTFQNEYYPMRKNNSKTEITLLFYERSRAMEATDVIKSSAPPFSVELYTHLKEIGTNQNLEKGEEEKQNSDDSDYEGTYPKKQSHEMDTDGFEIIR